MPLSEEEVQAIADAVAIRIRRPLLTIADISREYRCSISTVRRHIDRDSIPKRDQHGNPHDGGKHPILISRAEWEARKALSTRSVKNDLRSARY